MAHSQQDFISFKVDNLLLGTYFFAFQNCLFPSLVTVSLWKAFWYTAYKIMETVWMLSTNSTGFETVAIVLPLVNGMPLNVRR